MRSELQAAYTKRITTSLLKTLVHAHIHSATVCNSTLKHSVRTVCVQVHTHNLVHNLSHLFWCTQTVQIQIVTDTCTQDTSDSCYIIVGSSSPLISSVLRRATSFGFYPPATTTDGFQKTLETRNHNFCIYI